MKSMHSRCSRDALNGSSQVFVTVSTIVGSRAQFLRPFSGQDVLMIDFTSWGHLLKN